MKIEISNDGESGRLRARLRWLFQRDIEGGSPWDERLSCGRLVVDDGFARLAIQAPTSPPEAAADDPAAADPR